MDALDSILKIGQLGTSGVLLAILWQLWAEQKAQNAFIRQMLLDARDDRAEIKASIQSQKESH